MALKSTQSHPQEQDPAQEQAPAPAQGDSETTDGRVLRGARNRQQIVDAVYELLREGSVEPTAQQVAQRAGVAPRTVFRQFEDIEALAHAVGDRVMRELIPLLMPVMPCGQLHKDLAAIVARRLPIFEQLAPFRHAGSVMRHRSPFLRGMDEVVTRMQREEIDRLIAPHLDDEGGTHLEALDTLLSFESWDRMRGRQKLSRKRTEEVLMTAAVALTQAVARKGARRKG